MFKLHTSINQSYENKLNQSGYWPAIAYNFLNQCLYSKAVEVCRENLDEDPNLLSGRLIYARALYYAGQFESSRKQFNKVISIDPENITALKYIGDLNFAEDNIAGAMACYEKVLLLNHESKSLKSSFEAGRSKTTSTITLVRTEEKTIKEKNTTLREIPFYTETIGDLYLNQGFPRLAAEVFKRLESQQNNPRINDKLKIAEVKIKEKDQKYVKKTD
jgi:tetratricopeptide (TPR) repeat protein